MHKKENWRHCIKTLPYMFLLGRPTDVQTRCLYLKNYSTNRKMVLSPALKGAIRIHSHLLKLSWLCPPSSKKLLMNLVFGPHYQSGTGVGELEISRWGTICNRFLSIIPSTALRSESRTVLEQRQETTCKCRWYSEKNWGWWNSPGNDAVYPGIPSGRLAPLHCEEKNASHGLDNCP